MPADLPLSFIADKTGLLLSYDRSLSGGSIAKMTLLKNKQNKKFVLKQYDKLPSLHQLEANGLGEIAQTETIAVPTVVLVNSDFLLMEWIEPGNKSQQFYRDFGRQLASLHRNSKPFYGYCEDNYIGATPQHNGGDKQIGNWVDFFWEYRLLFQFRLAEKKMLSSPRLSRAMSRLEHTIDRYIQNDGEKPALLHGDLWSGNFLASSSQTPVLIDPAVYYGHREADLAMTILFGGFPDSFYEAYQQAWPLPDGWRNRVDLYNLYHILNHLNLFGGHYLQQAETMAERYKR